VLCLLRSPLVEIHLSRIYGFAKVPFRFLDGFRTVQSKHQTKVSPTLMLLDLSYISYLGSENEILDLARKSSRLSPRLEYLRLRSRLLLPPIPPLSLRALAR